jgi:hypothetical protein
MALIEVVLLAGPFAGARRQSRARPDRRERRDRRSRRVIPGAAVVIVFRLSSGSLGALGWAVLPFPSMVDTWLGPFHPLTHVLGSRRSGSSVPSWPPSSRRGSLT